MGTSDGGEPSRKHKAVREAKRLAAVFIYLALFLGAFTAYRDLVLAEEGIGYFHYGYSIVESLVLAKIILLGQYLRLGERYRHKPLIIPTLHKTFAFSILVVAFSVVEKLLRGLLDAKGWARILHEVVSVNRDEILARAIVMFVAFIPMFAAWEIARVLGERKVFELFFRRRPPGATSP